MNDRQFVLPSHAGRPSLEESKVHGRSAQLTAHLGLEHKNINNSKTI